MELFTRTFRDLVFDYSRFSFGLQCEVATPHPLPPPHLHLESSFLYLFLPYSQVIVIRICLG